MIRTWSTKDGEEVARFTGHAGESAAPQLPLSLGLAHINRWGMDMWMGATCQPNQSEMRR